MGGGGGERELAEITGSLEQVAGLEEKEEEESGSSVHGSESESDCSELFARVLAARAVFIEGARAVWEGARGEWNRCCVVEGRGEDVWESAGNGTKGCHVSSCPTLSKQATRVPGTCIYTSISPVECDAANQYVWRAVQVCSDICFHVRPTIPRLCIRLRQEKLLHSR